MAGRAHRSRDRLTVELDRLEQRRSSTPLVDVGFSIWERDRAVYAGTVSGALAFRFFLFLLPFTLLIVAVLSFAVDPGAAGARDLTDEFGLRADLAQAIADAASQGRSNRWWALAIGIGGTCWAALGCVRAIRLAHFLAWGMDLAKLRHAPRAVGVFIGINILTLGVPLLAEWARSFFGGLGQLIGLLGVLAVYTLIWVSVSMLLPHRPDAKWLALLPGAVVGAVGMYCLQIFTVYFLGPRLERSASVYGGLGVAAVILTWLFIIARLIVGSAVINAVIHQRQRSAHRRAARAAASGDERPAVPARARDIGDGHG